MANLDQAQRQALPLTMDPLEKIVLESSEIIDRCSLKLDKNGIPLSPQPSDDPSDPLNWRMGLKVRHFVNKMTI